jgi:integrase
MSKHRETGHMVERSPGKSSIVLSVKDATTGKRRRQWHSFQGTKREAAQERVRLLAAINQGTALEPNKTPLAKYLEQWLGHIRASVSPRTAEDYQGVIARHLAPELGNVILTKLTPMAISAAYDRIRASRQKGKGDLSPRTISHSHRVLSAALRQAVRWRLLQFNPAADVKPPKIERAKLTTYSFAQAADVLEALRDSWLHVPALLGVMCGMRRGEISALRWGNVDLDKGRLMVTQSAEQTRAGVRYKEPKSGQSRAIALSPAVVIELRAHRVRQMEMHLRLGLRMNAESFVVARADGSPYAPNSISNEWRCAPLNGLPRVRFHDLRHTHASHMLASGVHPKIASERLGHSRVGITLDLYSHVVEGLQEDAVARVDAAMAKAREEG